MSANRPLAVAVFNDSPTLRATLRAVLDAAPDMQIVAEQPDGRDAAEVVRRSGAEVVVMDVVMPSVDGFEASRQIMRHHPTPILMVSSHLDPRDQQNILAALQAGALHFIETPPGPSAPDFAPRARAFQALIRTLARAHLRPERAPAPTSPAPSAHALQVVGMVASAGGPQALLGLLPALGPGLPPILLVQHIARGFTKSFAHWLQRSTGYSVEIAIHGARARPGRLYLAPESHHLGASADLRLLLDEGTPYNGFRPSGDLLLIRLARTFGPVAAGIVLSGMGSDGTQGARALNRGGAPVLIQADPLIDGMPRAAAPYGHRLPLQEIGPWLNERSGLP